MDKLSVRLYDPALQGHSLGERFCQRAILYIHQRSTPCARLADADRSDSSKTIWSALAGVAQQQAGVCMLFAIGEFMLVGSNAIRAMTKIGWVTLCAIF